MAQRNYGDNNIKGASPATLKKYSESRMKFYEARFRLEDNPSNAVAKAKLNSAKLNMKKFANLAYDENTMRTAPKSAYTLAQKAKMAGKMSKSITPPAKKGMASDGKALTPAQKAKLKSMASGR